MFPNDHSIKGLVDCYISGTITLFVHRFRKEKEKTESKTKNRVPCFFADGFCGV